MVGRKEDTRTYQPITSYGVIGDCHSVVLVAPDGSVDWGCLPDFDSPAIFCRLLDAERGGYFQIAPTEGTIPGTQRYLRESNVLQTRFASISGEVVLTDFMPVETLSAWPDQDLENASLTRQDKKSRSSHRTRAQSSLAVVSTLDSRSAARLASPRSP